MAKSYINDGIIGNSRMLGCLTSEGELHRLFWPNIDHMQHIDRFEVGIKLNEEDLILLTDSRFSKSQKYLEGTNILVTSYYNDEYGIKITQSDFCLADRDALIRLYEIENLGDKSYDLGWTLFSSSITSTSHLTGTMFCFDHEALVHYQRDQYMSVSSNLEVDSFQLGSEADKRLMEGSLLSTDSVLMVAEGALTWKLGTIEAREVRSHTMQICFAPTYQELKHMLSELRSTDGIELYRDTKSYWNSYLQSLNPTRSNNQKYNELYERTLLVFKLMHDEAKGGLMAAPEADETMDLCGRYAYCWGRDAAFIADALDVCGMHQEVERFYEFAAGTQEEDGSWFQRYCMDGNLAPAWGGQVDETGALLYGIWRHYERTGNKDFLLRLWENVKLGLDYLVGFIDPETGLTKPSRDLWEERWGEHAYSAAAVHAGLVAGIHIADCLGIVDPCSKQWEVTAEKLKNAMITRLWDEDRQCFLRGIRTHLYPESKMEGQECLMVPMNTKGGMRKVVAKDRVADISLIGLSVPFGVLEAGDPRMVATANKLEELLTCQTIGGIRRYEDDEYIGGNPWILTTLWLALYYTENRQYDKALGYFEWASRGRTDLNLLPEQVSKDTGKPIWIVPLTWSHAMYALVFHALHNEKLI